VGEQERDKKWRSCKGSEEGRKGERGKRRKIKEKKRKEKKKAMQHFIPSRGHEGDKPKMAIMAQA